MAKRAGTILAPCLAAFVAACGGGGGGGGEPARQAGTLELFAGTATPWFHVDGPAESATFGEVAGIAVAPDGTVFVADARHSTIRSLLPTGMVATRAGHPVLPGFVDGRGEAARLHSPHGIALDAAGNLFVADTVNHSIRRIAPDGTVSTLAGNGEAGSADGIGPGARFNGPRAVAIDRDGSVLVADTLNSTIRRITPQGEVSTVAGVAGEEGSADGPLAAARFRRPAGIAVDAFGHVAIADTGNDAVRRWDRSTGLVLTVPVEFPDRFGAPMGLATDARGNIHVAEYGSRVVRRIAPTGEITVVAGVRGQAGAADGPAAGSLLTRPVGVAVGPDPFTVWIADAEVPKLRKLEPPGVVRTVAGATPVRFRDGRGTEARFEAARAMTADAAGNVYVMDRTRVRKVTPAAEVSTLVEDTGFFFSSALTGDGAGTLFAGQSIQCPGRFSPPGCVAGSHIARIDAAGAMTRLALSTPSGEPVFFAAPRSLARDAQGNLYLTTSVEHFVRKVSPAGVVTTLAGSRDAGFRDGAAADARFDEPAGLAVDTAGNLYVADAGNRAIRRIAADGLVTTVARLPGERGDPRLAFDRDGRLLIADPVDHTVRAMGPSGTLSIVAGAAGIDGFAPGPLPGLLRTPFDVAPVGNDVFVTMGSGVAAIRRAR